MHWTCKGPGPGLLAALLIVPSALAQPQEPLRQESLQADMVRPAQRAFDESLVRQLKVPDGFRVAVFARDLGKPRMMAVTRDGTVLVTRPSQGDVLALRDRDGDGRAEEKRTAAQSLQDVHGITVHGDRVYLATIKEVLAADLQPDGTLGAPRVLIRDLPDGGQHPNRTLAVGPDNRLYISVGSTCNSCDETNPESATLLRTGLEGGERTVFARGLRNTIGFGWHPETREMWGMDHGSDWRGNDLPPEELNRLREGADYGWPYCWGDRKPDRLSSSPEGSTLEQYCARTVGATLEHTAHSAPIGWVFYSGSQFPAEYRGDAFVALRGSWNRKPPSGYEVARIDFENGQPRRIEPFLSGFLLDGGRAHFGRLAGMAALPDGSLLVSDDTNGVIYRVARAQTADQPGGGGAQ